MNYKIKLLILFVFFILSNLFAFSQKNRLPYQLEISFNDSINGFVVLKYHKYDQETFRYCYVTLDSAKISNNKYCYRYNKVDDPFTVDIKIYEKDSLTRGQVLVTNPYFNFVHASILLDNSFAEISIDLHKRRSTPEVNKYGMYKGTISGSSDNEVDMKLCYDNFNSHKYLDKMRNNIINYDFIREYPKSVYLIGKIYQDRNKYLSVDSVQTIYDLFNKSAKESEKGKLLLKYIHAQKQIAKKGIADTFLFYDVSNKKYNFKDFVAGKKMGLLVFWASWCGPCKAELLVIKELNARYKNDVAFVSLSIDANKNDWIKAVARDSVEWLSLAGFPESNKKVMESFNVNIVPSIILVDKNGNILYKDVNGFGTIEDIYNMIEKQLFK